METNYTLYVAVLIGAIIYALIDFAGKKGTEVLTKKYLIAILANVLAGCALIWATELKQGIMQIGWFDAAKVIAMFFGIAGQKLFKSIMDITSRNVKTTIGINKK